MKRTRVFLPEESRGAPRQNRPIVQSKLTPVVKESRLKKRNASTSMVNTQKNKEQLETKNEAGEKLEKREKALVAEIDLETPDQSIDDVEKKTTGTTPMPNTDDQEAKTIEFSPIDNGNEITGNTPQTRKDDSQSKKDILHGEIRCHGVVETER